MIELYPWQKELLDRLLSKSGVITCHTFDYDKTTAFWVVAEEPSTDFILQCAKEYIETLDKHPDMDCDFMVYGKDESCKLRVLNT